MFTIPPVGYHREHVVKDSRKVELTYKECLKVTIQLFVYEDTQNKYLVSLEHKIWEIQSGLIPVTCFVKLYIDLFHSSKLCHNPDEERVESGSKCQNSQDKRQVIESIKLRCNKYCESY